MAQAKDYGTIAATASPGLQSLSLGFRLWVSPCDIRLAAERNMFSQKQPTVKKLNTKGRHNNNSNKNLIQINKFMAQTEEILLRRAGHCRTTECAEGHREGEARWPRQDKQTGKQAKLEYALK